MTMFRGGFKALLTVTILTILAHSAYSTTLIVPRDEDLIIEARAIVRGKVVAIRSGTDSQGDIFTYVTLKIREVFKGEIEDREIVIKEAGGEVESRGRIIFGTPEFEVGEKVLLFLGSWGDGSFRVDRMFLGKYAIETDPQTGESFVRRDTPGAHVSLVPSSESGPVTDRMALGAFRRKIVNTLAENHDRSVAYQAQHYAGIPFLIRPPEFVAGKVSGELTPQFRLLFNARWFEPDDGDPVRVVVNPEAAGPTSLDDVRAAAGAWSTVTGSALRVSTDGTGTACRGTGNIAVAFNSACYGSAGGSISALAVGGLDWNPSITKIINGTTFRRAVSGFVAVNPNAAGTDSCNLREILTHELGHALGLHHSWQSSFGGSPTAAQLEASMYWIAHFDGRCASLRTDDMEGVRFIYPGAGGPGPIGVAITTSTLPPAVVGSAYSQSLAASGGTPPYLWSLAAGSGPLPAGLNISQSGTVSGTPSAAGTSTFRVRLSDSAGGAVEKEFSISVLTSTGGFNAQLLSQTAPSTVTAGQSFSVSIQWKNIGSETWSAVSGIALASQNPPNNTKWGGNRVNLPAAAVVTAGNNLVITFTLFAPATPGTHDLQFQLFKDGVGFFGQPSNSVPVSVTPSIQVSISVPPFVEGVVGRPFTFNFGATGGQGPYSWSAPGGLPAWLTLNPGTGVLSGIPPSTGNTIATVRATDSAARSGENTLQIVVRPPVQLSTQSLPTGVRETAYNLQISATGGIQPYTWSIASGALPAGITLNQFSGLLSGTPTVTGTFTFTVSVRDTSGSVSERSLNLFLVGPDAVPRLNKVKYKENGKLVALGSQFSPEAILLIDDNPVQVKSNSRDRLVVKKLTLSPGQHLVRVVNPFNLSSTTVILTVD